MSSRIFIDIAAVAWMFCRIGIARIAFYMAGIAASIAFRRLNRITPAGIQSPYKNNQTKKNDECEFHIDL